ncbi:hypothetical protein BMT65_21010 [Escherichia coli]|nr:hypothetical protein BMT65_21010 [Escherichia coli]
MPENPASYRVVRTKSYLFNKAHSALLMLYDIDARQRFGLGANKLLKEQFSVESAARTIEMRLEACNAIN